MIVILAPLGAQTKNPFDGNRAEIDVGRGIFRIYCSPCHGIKADGGRGPDLTLAAANDEGLFKIITSGIEGTEMPSYGDRMDADSIWRLVAYIRSAARKETSPVRGSASNGEKLFWGKGGCGNCHRAGQRGSRMAPDLSMIGRSRSAGFLRESMTEPNATISPGYNTIAVETSDGRKISGVQRAYDAFSAQFVDAKDNYYSFLREEVKSMTREVKSMMPSYSKSLSAQELNDLVVYMGTLRGAK